MKLLKLLNIEKSEARPILMLIGYSFFMGLSIAFYFTATISDFLVFFDISYMPYTYILSGVLGYILWLIWSRMEVKMKFTTRVLIGISFLFITVACLGFSAFYFSNKWIFFTMLVWVRVFIFVNMVNFWGIAGKLFNISQGKRLFGVISIGSVISDLIGFFSIPLILLLGVQNSGLLFISLAALVICLLITVRISNLFRDKLAEESKVDTELLVQKKKEPFFKSKYHLYLFLLAILPMFGFYFVDFLFLDQIQLEFQNSSEAIANFMGIFFGVVALFELLVKTTVFSRLIYNFGLKITLLTMPVIIGISVILTLTMGILAGGVGFLFAMIAFIKLLEKVLRSGINDPSFQILYQPIPSAERLAFQSKMEGIPSALGNISAGVLLLILIYFNLSDPIIYNTIFLIVILFWCYMAYAMYFEYREVIVNNLSSLSNRKIQENDAVSDSSNGLESVSVRRLLLSQYIDLRTTFKKISMLLKQATDDLQTVIYSLIDKYRLFEYGPFVRAISGQEENTSTLFDFSVSSPQNEKELERSYINIVHSGHKTLEDRFTSLNQLSRSKIGQNQLKQIESFLKDTNPGIVQGALILIPTPLSFEYAEMLVQSMETMPLSHLVIPLFHKSDPRVEKLLIRKLQQIESTQWSNLKSQLLSLQLIIILSKIGEKETLKYLVKVLQFSNSEIKYFSLKALKKLKYRAEEEEEFFFVQMIEQEVAFCAWLLASAQDLSEDRKNMNALIKSLQKEFKLSQEKIFIFLSFIYPDDTIQKINENLKSSSTEKNVLGIEMCEMILKPTLRSILIPIFINSPAFEKLKLLQKDFPQQDLSPLKRLANICYHDFTKVNTWIKLQALDLLSQFEQEVPAEVIANVYIKNPSVKQASYLAIYRLDKEEFYKRIQHEPADYRKQFERMIGRDQPFDKIDSITSRVNKLKTFSLFSELYEGILLKIAIALHNLELNSESALSEKYGQEAYLHFVMNGELRLFSSEQNESVSFQPGSIIGLFEPFNLRDTDYTIESTTELMVIEAASFFQLVSIYDELAATLYTHAESLEPLEDYYFYSN